MSDYLTLCAALNHACTYNLSFPAWWVSSKPEQKQVWCAECDIPFEWLTSPDGTYGAIQPGDTAYHPEHRVSYVDLTAPDVTDAERAFSETAYASALQQASTPRFTGGRKAWWDFFS